MAEETKTSTPSPKKSGSGLEQNISGLLCYVLGFITGIIFLLIEKDNKFVRFHAMQSIVFSLSIFVINFVISTLLIQGLLAGMSTYAFLGLISTGLSLLFFILWIVLMVKAYGNEEWELPIIGKIAKNFANK